METLKILELLIGFILGIIGSYLFWRYMLFLKPQIEISPKILKGISHKFGNKTVYRIKLINIGPRSIIELKIRLTFCQLAPLGNGQEILVLQEKIFEKEVPRILGPKKNFGQHWSISPIYQYAFNIDQNVLDSLDNQGKLVLTVICTDSLSSTTLPIRITYEKHDIEIGDFQYDLSFNKIEDNPRNDLIDDNF
jgi:hypothetical protein